MIHKLGSPDSGARAGHLVERANRLQCAMAIFPDTGSDADIAKMRRSFMHAHAPAALGKPRRQRQASEPRAGYLGMSAPRHASRSWLVTASSRAASPRFGWGSTSG